MANVITDVTMDFCGTVSSDLFYTPMFRAPAVERFFTVLENIKCRSNMPIIGALQKITKKYVSCGLVETGNGTTISERELEPTKMQSHLTQCADAFECTIFEQYRKSGADWNDLTGTQLEEMILNVIMGGLQDDLNRQVWFNSTASGNSDYSAYDGVWRTLMQGVTGYDTGVTRYSMTSLGTDDLTPAEAVTALRGLISASSLTLRQIPKSQVQILITGQWFDALTRYMTDTPTTINIINNLLLTQGNGDVSEYETMMFDGYTIVARRDWDVWIDDLGETTVHRGIMWYKPNHFLATDRQSDFNRVKSWYSNDDDIQKFLARYQVGYNYALPQLVTIAY